MLKLWKYTTLVLALQLAVGGGVKAAAENLERAAFDDSVRALTCVFVLATVLAAVAASVIGLIAAIDVSIAAGFIATSAAFAAAALSFAISGIVADFDPVVIALAASFVAIAITFPAIAADKVTDGSPFWQRFICALPLGIGTVFGGLLILLRKRTATG